MATPPYELLFGRSAAPDPTIRMYVKMGWPDGIPAMVRAPWDAYDIINGPALRGYTEDEREEIMRTGLGGDAAKAVWDPESFVRFWWYVGRSADPR